MPRRHGLGAALAAMALLLLAACGSGPAPTGPAGPAGNPARGGTIDIGINTELSVLDPAANQIAAQSTLIVGNALYEPLFVDGPAGQLVPRLAESMTSTDLATWTLKLRTGLTFSDGSPLGAQAVLDHVTRLKDPAAKCQCARPAAEITAMSVVDATTATFVVKSPNAGFPRNFTRQLGMIASTTKKASDGSPLGAGPYVVSAVRAGSSVAVARNTAYWGSAPHADTIVFHFLPDTDSRYQSLAAGTLDMAWVDTPNLITQAKGEGRIVSTSNASTATAVFNTRVAPFDDARVRQAIQAAIDRNALLAVVDQGQGVVSNGPILSRSPYASPIKYPAFDPARAKALLASYGKPVEFAYTTDSRPQSMQRATALQQMLRDVGITMTIDVADSATWGSKLFGGKFGVIEFVTSGYGDTDSAMGLFVEGAVGNFGGYANPEVTRLVKQALATADPGARKTGYAAAAQIIADDAATLFFTESPAGFVATSSVGGVPDLSDRNIISVLPADLWIAP